MTVNTQTLLTQFVQCACPTFLSPTTIFAMVQLSEQPYPHCTAVRTVPAVAVISKSSAHAQLPTQLLVTVKKKMRYFYQFFGQNALLEINHLLTFD